MKHYPTEAYEYVRSLITHNYPYPQHQGKTDITEVIDFQQIGADYNLTNSQYSTLIDKAQSYHDRIDKKAKEA